MLTRSPAAAEFPGVRRSRPAAVLLPLVGLAVIGAGCNLALDARTEVEPALARRIAQKVAEIQAAPADRAKRLELGNLYLEAREFFDAAEAFRTASDGDKTDPAVHGGLAEAYLELGYFPSSLEQVRACFGKDRKEPGCLYVYGRMMSQIDDPQAQREAQGAYRDLLRVAPDFRKAKVVASELDQIDARVAQLPAPAAPASQPASAPAAPPTGEADKAPSADSAVAAGTPGHGEGVEGEEVGGLNPFGQAIAKAIQAVRRNDPAAAEAAFAEALTIRKDDPGALAGLAEMQFVQGKTTEATTNIDKAYTLDPKDAQVRWAFGRINVEQRRRVADGVAAWRALLADDPEYAKQLGVPERLEAIDKYAPGAPKP